MFKDILVPIELGDESVWKASLDKAVALARLCGGQLHLVSIVPDLGIGMVASYFPPDFQEKAIKEAHDNLQQVIKNHVPDDIPTQLVVENGKVWREILHAAEQTKADLIVIGANAGEGIEDYLLGTNAQRVAQHFTGSVLVVRG